MTKDEFITALESRIEGLKNMEKMSSMVEGMILAACIKELEGVLEIALGLR